MAFISRLIIIVFTIAVASALVLVGLKRTGGHLRKQSHPEKRNITEGEQGRTFPIGHKTTNRPVPTTVRIPLTPIPDEIRMELRKSTPVDSGHEQVNAAHLAVNKNQVMDELLARPDIPSDYGAEMVALYRDRTQDVYTRDFAVQHIGLYAETLNRRGTYDPASREAGELRRALWDASDETGSIVATAAFRALADLAAFDPKVDARRLDSRLLACVADANAAPSARVMSAQLCGERRVASSRNVLRRIAESPDEPHVLRLAATRSLELLAGRGVAR